MPAPENQNDLEQLQIQPSNPEPEDAPNPDVPPEPEPPYEPNPCGDAGGSDDFCESIDAYMQAPEDWPSPPERGKDS